MQMLLLAVVPPVATACIRLLCGTMRFVPLLEPDARPAYATPAADIYVFWHRCLLLAAYRYRDLGIHILISQSFDGELIARIVQRLGFVPVRGSSSRGGAAGLLALSRAYQAGHKVAITVDGPKGPVCVAKPGAAAVAANAAARASLTDGVTITAFSLHPQRAWTLRSWDSFLIPKPFTTVHCSWATPLPIATADTVPAITERMQAAIERVVALAEAGQAGL